MAKEVDPFSVRMLMDGLHVGCESYHKYSIQYQEAEMELLSWHLGLMTLLQNITKVWIMT